MLIKKQLIPKKKKGKRRDALVGTSFTVALGYSYKLLYAISRVSGDACGADGY